MPKKTILCAVLTGLLAVPVRAQDEGPKVALRWKFKAGDAFRYQQKTEVGAKMTMPVGDQEMASKQVQDFLLKVVSVGEDGTALLELRYERILYEMEARPGENLRFDSTKTEDLEKAKEHERLRPFAELLEGKIAIKVDAAGKVLEAKGLPEAPGRMQGVPDLGSIRALFVGFPKQPVAKGAGWKTQAESSVLAVSVKTAAEYTLSGVEEYKDKNCARIESKLKLEIDPAKNPLFKKMKSDVRRAEGSGIIMFALDEGRVVGDEFKLDLEFHLAGEMGDKAFEMTQNIHSETATELLPEKE